MRRLIFIIIAIILSLFGHESEAEEFNHQLYDSLLKQYVNEKGLVDYRGIKENKKQLTAYLKKLEQVDPGDFKKWSRHEKMAFWINAYNAITIEGVVRNYPIKYGSLMARVRFPKNSIRQLGDFWETVFIRVMGKDITLNKIEHQILCRKYKDPRVHGVLVCASMGCPRLSRHAYTAPHLNAPLDSASRAFIRNPDKVRLEEKTNTLYVSAIFDWYREDFKATPQAESKFKFYHEDMQGVMEFLFRYLPESQKNYILRNKPDIEFSDYSWVLNDQK